MLYSERELVSELKKRNKTAFEQLVRQYSRPAYLLASHILGGYGAKEDMEECVSDVFVEVWKRIGEYDPARGGFRTWVLVLAKYQALGYKRKLARVRVESLEDHQLEDQGSVEQEVLQRETMERIMEAISAFSPLDKELFIRRYYMGESISELMEALGLSRPAVDNRLLRGRKTIKEVLLCE